MKIVDNPTFTHNVPVVTPTDSGFEDENLSTTFNYLDVDAIDKFDTKTLEGTSALLEAAVVRFSGLTDANDQPLTCSEELREMLLKRQNVRQALCTYYFAALLKVKAGN
jgi:hypothetical protein